MRVIVYAEDLSGRKDDGYYSRPDLASALDIFFAADAMPNFSDPDSESEISRSDAEALFKLDRRVIFYNQHGEKVIISSDSSDLS